VGKDLLIKEALIKTCNTAKMKVFAPKSIFKYFKSGKGNYISSANQNENFYQFDFPEVT